MALSAGTTADLLLGCGTSSYSFAKDHRGQPLIATMADVNAATKPSDKLAIAAQVAESVRLQADAAIRTGRADRVADMTAQARQVMDAVTAVVSALRSPDTQGSDGKTKAKTGATAADPALKSYQDKIAKVLTSLAGSLPGLKALTARAPKDVAGKTTDSLKSIDTAAADAATLAGTSWQPVMTPASRKNGGSAPSAARLAGSMPRLLDLLA
ncbi:MAG: hypothetical protein WCO00_05970 [Rhodospirillaceae bacterium]